MRTNELQTEVNALLKDLKDEQELIEFSFGHLDLEGQVYNDKQDELLESMFTLLTKFHEHACELWRETLRNWQDPDYVDLRRMRDDRP